MGGVGHTPTPSRSHRGGKFPNTYSEPIHREGETPIRTREHYYPPLDRERWLSGLQNRWFSSESHIDFECLHCWMQLEVAPIIVPPWSLWNAKGRVPEAAASTAIKYYQDSVSD